MQEISKSIRHHRVFYALVGKAGRVAVTRSRAVKKLALNASRWRDGYMGFRREKILADPI